MVDDECIAETALVTRSWDHDSALRFTPDSPLCVPLCVPLCARCIASGALTAFPFETVDVSLVVALFEVAVVGGNCTGYAFKLGNDCMKSVDALDCVTDGVVLLVGNVAIEEVSSSEDEFRGVGKVQDGICGNELHREDGAWEWWVWFERDPASANSAWRAICSSFKLHEDNFLCLSLDGVSVLCFIIGLCGGDARILVMARALTVSFWL